MSYITNFLYFRNAFRSKGGTEIKNIPKLKDIFWNHSQNSEEIGQKKPTIHNRVILKRHRRHSIVHYGATAQFWLRQHHHTAEYSRNTCFVTQFSLRFKNKADYTCSKWCFLKPNFVFQQAFFNKVSFALLLAHSFNAFDRNNPTRHVTSSWMYDSKQRKVSNNLDLVFFFRFPWQRADMFSIFLLFHFFVTLNTKKLD